MFGVGRLTIPGGAVQGKAMDSAMAKSHELLRPPGASLRGGFSRRTFLKGAHPEFNWQAPLLRDMKAGPWTRFKAGERSTQ